MIIKKSLINKSIEYILQHIHEDISIEDVANYCNFSKYYFSRMFKEETEVSIYAFIKRMRMDQSSVSLKVEKIKLLLILESIMGTVLQIIVQPLASSIVFVHWNLERL